MRAVIPMIGLTTTLLLSGCVSSQSNKTGEDKQAVSDKAPRKLEQKKPAVIINDDIPISTNSSECSNPYFTWLTWENVSPAKFQTMANRGEFKLGKGISIPYKKSGSQIRLKTHKFSERIFEEELVAHGYTYPFSSMNVVGSGTGYKTSITLDFSKNPLDHNWVMSLGQLFRYTPKAMTKVVLSSPEIDNWDESIDFSQTAASYRSVDFDSEVGLKSSGKELEIYQDGASGTSSGYIMLRLKKVFQIKTLNIRLENQGWKGAKANTFDFALAKLHCNQPTCRYAGRAEYYNKGKLPSGSPAQDPSQALGSTEARPASQNVALGAQGQIILALDGVSLNREGHELELIASEGSSCKTVNLNLAAYGRYSDGDDWTILKKGLAPCGTTNLDLQLLPRIRYVKLENKAKSSTSKPFLLRGIRCRNR